MAIKAGSTLVSGCLLVCGLASVGTASLSAQQRSSSSAGGQPAKEMLKACEDKSLGDRCFATPPQRSEVTGTCFAPQGRPLACRPRNGLTAQDGRQDGADFGQELESFRARTTGILCGVESGTLNAQLGLQSKAKWFCSGSNRMLTANGIPDHTIGKFPNSNNSNHISEQTIIYPATLTPLVLSGPGQRIKVPAYALNGIKFDPDTKGRCETGTTDPSSCHLESGTGPWSIEALGQSSFDFGLDKNHANVQPTGEYHYLGIPEGMLSEQNKSGQAMQLIGWAADGFPVYARYGYDNAKLSSSILRSMESSYRLKTIPDAGRPSTKAIPMGAFTQDYEFAAGSGDLDECNGRFAVTPDFPEGIYHYYATDSYPFIQRCVKGSPFSLSSGQPPVTERGDEQPGQGRRGRRPPPPGGQRQ